MENIIDRTIPLAEINEPNLSYEYNEFVIRKDPTTGVFWAGSDGGCSCYSGFDPANFEPFNTASELRVRFHQWVGEWRDGAGHEAAAWEDFHSAVV